MIIEQKFQTVKGIVTIKRIYKNLPNTQVVAISETFVEIPTEDQHLSDLVHSWAASVRSEDRLQRPTQQILALIGRTWSEIVE